MAEIGAGLIVNGVVEILKKLIPMATQEIAMARGVKDDLRKLRNTLEMIVAVTVDAEKRQVSEEAVRVWLRRLKDVAYDADDVLDEFSYEAMRRGDQMRSLKDKVRNLASSSNRVAFPFKMAHKIKNLNEKFDAITKNMHDFGFLVTNLNTTTNIHQSREQPNRKTASYVDDSEIVGRENDKSEIVKLLLMTNKTSLIQSHSGQYEKVSVISVVGMGGLGKTTLAQLVYNDESVVKHFDLKMWVCVSDDFDVFTILRNIMESITKTKCDDVSNVDLLVSQVQEKLTGKKYLLVLDDLWNENDLEWGKLKTWLNVGAQGSKILVTTRLDQVASVVRGIIPPYKLEKLSEAKCWSIIKSKAFSPGGALETPKMINIGKEIAKKCCGLPLAAIFLGGLMRSRREESEWRSIKDQNDVWDKTESSKNIIPILKLSYDNLPSHLKQCFSYCCIFPKDWNINKELLIRLWMAEGFLHRESEETMEDIGNEYFESLLSNSFFQDLEKNELGDIETCKMHDLVHDLAQKVVGKHECSTIKISGETANVSKVRRLLLGSFAEGIPRTFPKALHNAKRLRTIVDFQSKGDELDLNSFLSNKYLRVLHVQNFITIDSPPSSIPKMKHLRYLDLSFSNIQSHNLSTICSFYNLQSLVLHGCRDVWNLPSNIGSLKNLRYLDVSRTYIQVLPDSITNLCNLRTLKFDDCFLLQALPSDFGKLKHLRSLDLSYTKIEKLPDSITRLCNLRILKFDYCENLNALPSDFGKLKQLRSLDVSHTRDPCNSFELNKTPDQSKAGIRVLPESCTENLTNLEIVHLGGDCKLPKEIKNWTKLRHLTISFYGRAKDEEMPRGIEKLTSLQILKSYVVRTKKNEVTELGSSGIEELHDLNLLEELNIVRLENVRDPIDAERANLKAKLNIRKLCLFWEKSDFEDDGRSDCDAVVLEALQPHPNLKELSIFDFMGSWLPTWMGGSVSSSSCLLINLVELNLNKCRRCEKLPALGQLPSLRILWIDGMKSLKRMGEELYGGREFPSLIKLHLHDMESLEEWVAPPSKIGNRDTSFPLLEEMTITGCPKLTTTPTSFPSLKKLRSQGSNGEALCSMARDSGLTTLASLDIEDLPELIYLPSGLLQCLQNIEIRECDNFRGFRDLDYGGDISSDEVDEVAKSVSGTRELLNNCCSLGLSRLVLEDCPSLTFLPDLQGFTTLRRLTINNCNDELKNSLPHDRNCLSFIEYMDIDFWENDSQSSN